MVSPAFSRRLTSVTVYALTVIPIAIAFLSLSRLEQAQLRARAIEQEFKVTAALIKSSISFPTDNVPRVVEAVGGIVYSVWIGSYAVVDEGYERLAKYLSAPTRVIQDLVLQFVGPLLAVYTFWWAGNRFVRWYNEGRFTKDDNIRGILHVDKSRDNTVSTTVIHYNFGLVPILAASAVSGIFEYHAEFDNGLFMVIGLAQAFIMHSYRTLPVAFLWFCVWLVGALLMQAAKHDDDARVNNRVYELVQTVQKSPWHLSRVQRWARKMKILHSPTVSIAHRDVKPGHILRITDKSPWIPADAVCVGLENCDTVLMNTSQIDGESTPKLRDICSVAADGGIAVAVDVHQLTSGSSGAAIDDDCVVLYGSKVVFQGVKPNCTPAVIVRVVLVGRDTKLACKRSENVASAPSALDSAVGRFSSFVAVVLALVSTFNALSALEHGLGHSFRLMFLEQLLYLNMIFPASIRQMYQTSALWMKLLTRPSQTNDYRALVLLKDVAYWFSDKTGSVTKNRMDVECIAVYNEEASQWSVRSTTEATDAIYTYLALATSSEVPQQSSAIPEEKSILAYLEGAGVKLLANAAKSGGALSYTAPDGQIIDIPQVIELGIDTQLVAKGRLLRKADGQWYSVWVGRSDPFWERFAASVLANTTRLRQWLPVEQSILHEGVAGVERVWLLGDARVSNETATEFMEKWQVACSLSEKVAKLQAQNAARAWLVEHAPPVMQAATLMVDAFRDGVPDAVRELHAADIPGGIITGDKRSTAKRMAEKIGLGQAVDVEGTDPVQLRQHILALRSQAQLQTMSFSFDRPQLRVLEMALENARAPSLFRAGNDSYQLLREFSDLFVPGPSGLRPTAIFSAAEPFHKAMVVNLFKRYVLSSTERVLFIGDGANDLMAIGAAHVSYGIVGEGGQAARQASFAGNEWAPIAKLILNTGVRSSVLLASLIKVMYFKHALTGFSLAGWLVYSDFARWIDPTPTLDMQIFTAVVAFMIMSQSVCDGFDDTQALALLRRDVFSFSALFRAWILGAVHGLLVVVVLEKAIPDLDSLTFAVTMLCCHAFLITGRLWLTSNKFLRMHEALQLPQLPDPVESDAAVAIHTQYQAPHIPAWSWPAIVALLYPLLGPFYAIMIPVVAFLILRVPIPWKSFVLYALRVNHTWPVRLATPCMFLLIVTTRHGLDPASVAFLALTVSAVAVLIDTVVLFGWRIMVRCVRCCVRFARPSAQLMRLRSQILK
eukprot:TRINITY_DN2001_c0_g2_i2.p2 TRINITY_DN2001_c0_g2~~TRINITY_DN2001_c0_g2_i2.p2  ORF type:complete len:1231 (+),score=207.82 TRINITY_DN2001_c0_g2_i2:92-3784(+)